MDVIPFKYFGDLGTAVILCFLSTSCNSAILIAYSSFASLKAITSVSSTGTVPDSVSAFDNSVPLSSPVFFASSCFITVFASTVSGAFSIPPSPHYLNHHSRPVTPHYLNHHS
ncbi:MAG: hypothetical protein L0922_00780, partial [Candidatus Mariimomonas ferrooxydans]